MTDTRILGLGTDLVDISRFRDLEPTSPLFGRVFTESEMKYCKGFSDSAPHFASTFAAKEASLKALPHGSVGSLSEIEILRDEQGAPSVRLPPSLHTTVLVSMSHTRDYAVAVAISLPDSSSSNSHELRKLLNGASSEVFPE